MPTSAACLRASSAACRASSSPPSANNALASLELRRADGSGAGARAAVLTITVDDGGFSGAGGPLQATLLVPVALAPRGDS